jgi:O-methyltransferase involved in polyketide biosynthesis
MDQLEAEVAGTSESRLRSCASSVTYGCGCQLHSHPERRSFFEYSIPKDLVDEETQKILAVAMTATQARGEPQRSFFEPVKLAEQVREVGFAEVSDFGPDEAKARYFNDRTDGLRPLALTHITCECGLACDSLETASIRFK